jgi:DpnII restriction endonuclease
MRVVDPAVPEMFRKQKPKNEPDLNEKIAALLKTHQPQLRSEHPTRSFACARVIPDHDLENFNVLIEAKYIRGNTSPSKASDGIAADLTKYPIDSYILFLVYDSGRAVPNDRLFQEDIESKGRCSVQILR